MTWLVIVGDEPEEDGFVHVVPDTSGHTLNQYCFCVPTKQNGDNGPIMVHHLPN